MVTRSEAKAKTRQRLLAAAHGVLKETGAATLSLREVARRAGIVPSAVYRHFDSRDALLTQLIIDAYTDLARSLEAATADEPTAEPEPNVVIWRHAADALRTWALAHPHQFLLAYGTPVPGYQAPAETIGAAARVAAVFITNAPVQHAVQITSPLDAQLSEPAAEFGVTTDQLARALTQVAQLVGALILELGGHFVGTADPVDHLWDQIVAGQTDAQPFTED